LHFNGNGTLLEASSWTKSEAPLFQQSIKNQVFAPGHNSFFKSPNGKEDWILYHANSKPGEGCGNKRSPRMQIINWDSNGFPLLGEPVKEGSEFETPAE
jgi:GH43 family beta-xylosidase